MAANNLLAFIISIMAARKLGVEGFGIFSLAFSVATLVGVIGDLGFNLSVIRLFNKYQSEPEKQIEILASALGFKIFFFVTVLIVSFPSGDILVRYMGVGFQAQKLFAVACFSGGLLFLWTYLQSYLQAYRSFKRLTMLIWAYSGLRFLCLIAAYSLFPKDPLAWLAATYTVPLMILVIVGVAPKGREMMALPLRRPGASLDALRELLGYSKWVALSVIAYTAMPYLVRFILAIRASVAEVGIFSAGMTFTVAFSTLNTALQAVLFPQVTALEGREKMKTYLRKLRNIAPHYLGVAAVGVVALAFLQWLVLGREYRAALPVFMVTAGAFAISVLLYLETMLLHTLMRPDIDAVINLLGLVLLVAVAFLAAGKFGALGVAIVYGCVIVLGGMCKRMWLSRII